MEVLEALEEVGMLARPLVGLVLSFACAAPAGPDGDGPGGDPDEQTDALAGRGGAAVAGRAGSGGAGGADGAAAPDDAAAGRGAMTADARPGGGEPRPDAAATAPDGPAPPTVGGDVPPCQFKLCESFEGFADGAFVSNATWRKSGSAPMVVDSTRAARGKKSLHITGPTTSTETFLRETRTFPARNGAFYGRLYLWIDQTPTQFPQGVSHWNIIEASGQIGYGGKVIRYGGHQFSATNNQWSFNIETHGQGETTLGDRNSRIPTKTWMCIEWYFDTPRQEARFWWNGQERTAIHWNDNRPGTQFVWPELRQLSIGLGQYQRLDRTLEIWIDEIAVHDARIGCGS